LFFVASLVSVTRSNEPSYQGKKLSQWLEELGDPEPELQGDAELRRWQEVFGHMGTNAIPFLLRRLQSRDSALKIKVIDWAERHDVSAPRFQRAEFRQTQAAVGFRLLGPQAASARAALVAILNRGGAAGWYAAYALAGIGQEAVPPLAQALTNLDSEIRRSAAFALCGLKEADGSSSIPNLITALNDTNRHTRLCAVTALGRIAKRPDSAVPALAERLNERDGMIRNQALSALAKFGREAQATVPVLLELAADRKDPLHDRAAQVLKQIAPETPTDF